MGTIAIKKEGTEYIESLITSQSADDRLYVVEGQSKNEPFVIKDGDGYQTSTGFEHYNKLTNIWYLYLPYTSSDGDVIDVQLDPYKDMNTPTSSFPEIDSNTNRRGMWNICTFKKEINPSNDVDIKLWVRYGSDPDPGGGDPYENWFMIDWPKNTGTSRTGIIFWNGTKWMWFGEGNDFSFPSG